MLPEAAPLGSLVEHLFRHEAGRITASLTRALGARHMDLAEEATQEALIRALQTWRFRGVPPQPRAWLHTTARHYALDQLRRASNWAGMEPMLRHYFESQPGERESSFDDTLAMMLLCCHPDLPPEGRLALTLKTVSGFSTGEIAAACLTSEETVAQRIVRAKRRIREGRLEISLPSNAALQERLGPVCEVIYSIFNEGYFASGGDTALRRSLCEEAVRLIDCLLDAGYKHPDRYALKALFHLHMARFAARTGDSGELLDGDAYDPESYDRDHIESADRALEQAMAAGVLSAWHLEAAIAGQHCHPNRDWNRIAALYDALLGVKPSPVVELNRAVALFRSGQREIALAVLDRLEQEEGLRGYTLLSATQARLHEEAGNRDRALAFYRKALARAMNAPARRFLERRLGRIET